MWHSGRRIELEPSINLRSLYTTRCWIAALLLVYAGLLAWEAYCQSPTYLEIAHLPAGLSHWQLRRFELFAVNPPLVRTLAAVPVLLVDSETDWSRFSTNVQLRAWHTIGQDYLRCNGKRSLWLFTLSRWACIPFGLLGSYICYRWASCLVGSVAGGIASVLWCFSPYILGHGATINPDVPAAAGALAAIYWFWRWLKRPSWREAIIAGLMLGLAELCKFTLLVFYPLLPLLWGIYRRSEREATNKREWLRQGGMLVVTLVVSICVINWGYLFEGTFTPLKDFQFRSMLFTGYNSVNDIPPDGANRFSSMILGMLPVPLPADCVRGIDIQQSDFEQGLPSYLRGEWAEHGWWHYYLYALLVKMPLGTLCLALLAVAVTVFGNGYSSSWRDEMVVLAPFIVILVVVSGQTGFSVHSRYIIPALPFLFVWMSKVARVFEMRPFTRKRLAMAIIVVLTLTWSVGSSLAAYPHSLSYFNELATVLPTPADVSYPEPIGRRNYSLLSAVEYAIAAGPRNGPRHLLDSNIDWGQDLLYLKVWLDKHPDVNLDGLVYFGSYPSALAGIPNTPYPAPGPIAVSCSGSQAESTAKRDFPVDQLGPKPGWYAVSVNYLYDCTHQYRYFLNFQPVAMAGYSIYIYYVTLDEANRVRKELGMPELPKDCQSWEDTAHAR